MPPFTMIFTRLSEGVPRDSEAWDRPYPNLGCEKCEDVLPVPLAASDLEDARVEAIQRWCDAPSGADQVDGYWILDGDGEMVSGFLDQS